MTSNKTVTMLRYYSKVQVLALIGLTKPEHPAHDLFEAIKDTIAGVSCGCADVFGAAEDAVKWGCDLIKDNSVPGTTGLPSLRQLKRIWLSRFNILAQKTRYPTSHSFVGYLNVKR